MEFFTGNLYILIWVAILVLFGWWFHRKHIKPIQTFKVDTEEDEDTLRTMHRKALRDLFLFILAVLLYAMTLPLRYDQSAMNKTEHINFDGPKEEVKEPIEVPEFERRTEQRLEELREKNAEISENIEKEKENDS